MRSFSILSGALLVTPLVLSACAGTPPKGEAAQAANHKCTHVTGSLLCEEDEDQPVETGLKSPSVGQAQIYVGGGPQGGP